MALCYKIKHGTDYDRAVKKHHHQMKLWENVFPKVGKLLGEEIKRIRLEPKTLWVSKDELKNEESKRFFTKDGKLKNSSKKAKEILKKYLQIINEEGLSDFQDIRIINFIHGACRYSGENLEMFFTSEGDLYYKADFNLEGRTKGQVELISEIEYEEKYLEELKMRQ